MRRSLVSKPSQNYGDTFHLRFLNCNPWRRFSSCAGICSRGYWQAGCICPTASTVNTEMRWPPPRAHTAQPERWRMRRRSKEPRRMSEVEGSEAASLARASRVLSERFIYIYETIKRVRCQELSKHFYKILFF